MSSVSRETKTMLFPDEDIPETYIPSCGVGLVARDGHPLQEFTVPKVDKEKLRKLLQHKAASKPGEAR